MVSEKSLKRAKDFLNSSIKVKHRYTSLKAFHDYASDLEQAEFYEEHDEFIFLFFFECYLLMVQKSWILDRPVASSNDFNATAQFAFESNLSEDEMSKESLITKLGQLSSKINPTNSEAQEVWLTSLKRSNDTDDYLRFPKVFSKLLQYIPIQSLIESPLMPILIRMIRRLLHSENLLVLRLTGLRMLLGLLKSMSHGDKDVALVEECIQMFQSLVNASIFNLDDPAKSVLDFGPSPLIEETNIKDVRTVELVLLNEIFSFITWDLDPDSHSLRFLYDLIRDHYLSQLYPIGYEYSAHGYLDQVKLSEAPFDKGINSDVQEMIVDYLGLWFLKSGTKSFKFGSTLLPTARLLLEQQNSKLKSGSMVSLAVNDLTTLFGANSLSLRESRASLHSMTMGGTGSNANGSQTASPTASKADVPVASFLLEEIILSDLKDVFFIHLILRSACTSLSISKHMFTIRLVMEIFRTWTFNPIARRPSFLAVSEGQTDDFVSFYIEALSGIFPPHNLSIEKDSIGSGGEGFLEMERSELYREVFYFFRALALQAFIPLEHVRWQQLLHRLTGFADVLLPSKHFPEDALMTETLLGTLLRAGPISQNPALSNIWTEAARVLGENCQDRRGAIEEWCRILEGLAVILVKENRYNNVLLGSSSGTNSKISLDSHGFSGSDFSVTSQATKSPSQGSLPTGNTSFSAWSDLPAIKGNSLGFFRNILRLLGDPVTKLASRPDLLQLVFESLEACMHVFLKCRRAQPLHVAPSAIPPFLDLLPPALSLLLKPPAGGFEGCRVIAWRIVGSIMFRPADILVPDHYWGALLVAFRSALQGDLSNNVDEFAALLKYVGLPLSSASVPGLSVALKDLIDGLLCFYNESLWSGGKIFSAQQAWRLIPVSIKICFNALQLAQILPEQFGSFRDSACLIRLFSRLSDTLTDGKLTQYIYEAAALLYLSDCVSIDNDSDASARFSQEMLKLFMKPFHFPLGTGDLGSIEVICEYLTALAHLKAAHRTATIELETILKLLLKALEQAAGRTELEASVVHIVQGPLTEIVLFAWSGRIPAELRDCFFRIFDLEWKSSVGRQAILDFSQRLMTLAHAFPGPFGPSLLGSAPLLRRNSSVILALSPSSTILSFEAIHSDVEDGNLEIMLTATNALGTFSWRYQPINVPKPEAFQSATVSTSQMAIFPESVEDSAFCLPFIESDETVMDTDEIPVVEDREKTDVLKLILKYLEVRHPDVLKRGPLDQNSLNDFSETDWHQQCQAEERYGLSKRHEVLETLFRGINSEGNVAVVHGLTAPTLLRGLLSSMGLLSAETYLGNNSGELGIELLQVGSDLFDELEALDLVSGRERIKLGCLFVGEKVEAEEVEDESKDDYNNFLSSLAVCDDSSRPYFGYRAGLQSEEEKASFSLPFVMTPAMEIVVHEPDTLQQVYNADDLELRKHLGNDSVLIIWHEDESSLVNSSPIKSDLLAAIIRVLPHGSLPGYYRVTMQSCYERLIQPRKYARLRADPFALKADVEEIADGNEDMLTLFMASNVQGSGLIVPRGALGSVVRSLAVGAWRRAHLIECIRSENLREEVTEINVSHRLAFAPETIRKQRIAAIINRFGLGHLSYDQFLARLFK